MFAATTRAVIKDDDPVTLFQVIAAVSPKVGPFGFALARVKLLLPFGFIGVQNPAPA